MSTPAAAPAASAMSRLPEMDWIKHDVSVQLKNGLRTMARVNDKLWMSSRDGSIHVRSFVNGSLQRNVRACMRDYHVPLKFFAQVIVSDKDRAWIGSSDGNVRAYDLRKRRFVFEIAGQYGPIRCLHSDQDGVWVAAESGPLTKRDRKGRALLALSAATNVVVRALASVGDDLWAAADDGVRVWHRNGPFRARLVGHTGAVAAICRVGSRVWSGGDDGRICVWDAASRNLERVLMAHASTVFRLLVVAGEVWSVSIDGVLRVWDALTGECRFAVKRMDRIIDIVAENASAAGDGRGDVVWIGFRNPPSLERFRVAPVKRLFSPFEAIPTDMPFPEDAFLHNRESPRRKLKMQTTEDGSLDAGESQVDELEVPATSPELGPTNESKTSDVRIRSESGDNIDALQNSPGSSSPPNVISVSVRSSPGANRTGPVQDRNGQNQNTIASEAIRQKLQRLTEELAAERSRNEFLEATLSRERESFDAWKEEKSGFSQDVRRRCNKLRGQLPKDSSSDHRSQVVRQWALELATAVVQDVEAEKELAFLSAVSDEIASLDQRANAKRDHASGIRDFLQRRGDRANRQQQDDQDDELQPLRSSAPQSSDLSTRRAMTIDFDQVRQERASWSSKEAVLKAKVLDLEKQLHIGSSKNASLERLLHGRLASIESELQSEKPLRSWNRRRSSFGAGNSIEEEDSHANEPKDMHIEAALRNVPAFPPHHAANMY